MKGHNNSVNSIIAFPPVSFNNGLHWTESWEDMGLSKHSPNCHSPVGLTNTEFPRKIKLDKVGIIPNRKAGSCIGFELKTKIGLGKDAMVSSMDTEDIVPVANRCSAGPSVPLGYRL